MKLNFKKNYLFFILIFILLTSLFIIFGVNKNIEGLNVGDKCNSSKNTDCYNACNSKGFPKGNCGTYGKCICSPSNNYKSCNGSGDNGACWNWCSSKGFSKGKCNGGSCLCNN
jgi:hypothetical protein